MARTPQMLGRARAMQQMKTAAPGPGRDLRDREPPGDAGLRAREGVLIDDTWATIGSDNFNRRSWTHDSELSAVVVDPSADDHSPYVRRLRLTLAAEHLDREVDDDYPARRDGRLRGRAGHVRDVRRDGAPPRRLARRRPRRRATARADSAASRNAQLGRSTRAAVMVPYLLLHDPDGRPKPLRQEGRVLSARFPRTPGETEAGRAMYRPARLRSARQPCPVCPRSGTDRAVAADGLQRVGALLGRGEPLAGGGGPPLARVLVELQEVQEGPAARDVRHARRRRRPKNISIGATSSGTAGTPRANTL